MEEEEEEEEEKQGEVTEEQKLKHYLKVHFLMEAL
jgi:hypothetical protein